jgi:histone H3/H4
MSLVVKAKIRDYAKVDDKVLNVSGDFADRLSEKVEAMIRESCRRAKDNGRSTVMAKDL